MKTKKSLPIVIAVVIVFIVAAAIVTVSLMSKSEILPDENETVEAFLTESECSENFENISDLTVEATTEAVTATTTQIPETTTEKETEAETTTQKAAETTTQITTVKETEPTTQQPVTEKITQVQTTVETTQVQTTKSSAETKEEQARAVAQELAQGITGSTDIEKVQAAAMIVADYSSRATYTMEGDDYDTAYGVFIKGEYSCAGSTRALGMLLECMGYSWTHVNEHQYTHQWVELEMDGQKGWADGQIGFVGYGDYPFA